MGAAGWTSVFFPSPPSLLNLNIFFIDISLPGQGQLSEKRRAAALFHPGRSLADSAGTAGLVGAAWVMFRRRLNIAVES